jgi:hypothetical protein
MAVGEDQHFQFLKGRIGRVESLDDEVHWRGLQGKNVELYLFDPLRISLESYTDHKLGTAHANFNRRSVKTDQGINLIVEVRGCRLYSGGS